MKLEPVRGDLLPKQDRNERHCHGHLLTELRYHSTCVNGSTSNQESTTDTLFEVSKKMISLLRHDRSVLRERDGAVEFKILAPMLASPFESSPALVNSNMAELFAKRRWSQEEISAGSSLCRDNSIPSSNSRPLWKKSKLIQHCKTTCCYRATSPSTSTTFEAPTTCTPSSNQD